MQTLRRIVICGVLWGAAWGLTAHAAESTPAHWLPPTTRGYVFIPNGPALREAFKTTQLSALVNDPSMKPFVEDVRAQIEKKVGELQQRMGISWRDLQAAQAGAWATAAVELDDKNQPYAFVLMIDTQGKEAQRDEVLAKVGATMTREKAQATKSTEQSVEITVYTLPREAGSRRERRLALFEQNHWLVATDHPQLAKSVAQQMQGGTAESLADGESYRTIVAQVQASPLGEQTHLSWFVEPFGYARILKAMESANPTSQRRGRNWYQVLSDQGFDAVQAAGGGLRVATGSDELLHCTQIYAPGAPQAAEKFRLAARMLNFPAGGDFDPPAWVPQHVGSYVSFNVKLQDAFDYVSTLVDAIAEQEGFFKSVLDGIKTEEFGPKIDLEQELVSFLGEKARVISDYELPISPQCERLLVAVEVTDPERVAQALERTLKDDQTVRRLEHGDHVIWELLNSEEEDLSAPEVVTPGFNTVAPAEEKDQQQPRERIFPNSAITVAHGQLIWTSHVDFAEKLLTLPAEDQRLSGLADYPRVTERLQALGANGDSFRFFSQIAEDYRPTYDLVRMGKMPESQTVLGKILNRLMGPEEKNVLREQKLDGTKLPEFETVRKYLGAAGTYVKTTEHGWFICGCMLPPASGTVEQGQKAKDESPEFTAANPKD